MARKKPKNRRQDRATKAAIQPPAPNEVREVLTLNPAPTDLDLSGGARWYLLFTSPRAESRVIADLQEAGCATFWPSIHKLVTVGKRVRFNGDVATYPRYVFASGSLLDGEKAKEPLIVKGKAITGVFDIDGVQSIVSDHTGWIRVPINALRRVADYQNKVEPPKPSPPPLKPGDEAVIISGPFTSFLVTIVDEIGLHNAKVLINAFGGPIPMTVGLDHLRAA